MTYRRLGQTDLQVSAVGFGTCQLRLKSEQQAIDTLKRGFELGVNIVHTAPDYEGTDDLVAEAVKQSGRDVIVASQGYGNLAHFEYLFEEQCRKVGKQRLELFGIAAVEDRIMLGENVYGPGGMVEFIKKKKAEGRIGATFCTTHGTPEDIAGLITGGHFDAIMLAYNRLGFHLLSYYPQPPIQRENIARNGAELFPLAVRHGVGLMVMKPLAGGLLCRGKAFPPREGGDVPPPMRAADLLRDILQRPEVSCVLPGTASIAEAEENASAGHAPTEPQPGRREEITYVVETMPATICSRCGVCDELCSQKLPVSWLFRDSYISHYPSETFETLDQLQYFHLHPRETATCIDCPAVTCACPQGIAIPSSLIRVHGRMVNLRATGMLPITPAQQHADGPPPAPFFCRVISRMFPPIVAAGESIDGALWVQNEGPVTWRKPRPPSDGCTLALYVGNELQQVVPLRHDAEPGTRTHFAIGLRAPRLPGDYPVRAVMISGAEPGRDEESAEVFSWQMTVVPQEQPALVP